VRQRKSRMQPPENIATDTLGLQERRTPATARFRPRI
jgi:hypothetical protein